MNELTKKERTRRQLILALLDGKKKTQQILADEIGEKQDYISPIIKQLEKEEIIKRELGTSPKTYTDRTSEEKVTKDYVVKFCYLNPSLNTFKLLAKEFLRFEERVEFIQSQYVQSMLSDKFLDSQLETFWEMIETSEILKGFAPLVKILALRPTVFRKFPLGLYYFLFPEEIEKELSPLQKLGDDKKGPLAEFGNMLSEQMLTPEGIQLMKKNVEVIEQTLKRHRTFLAELEKKMEEKHADNP